MKGGGRKAYGLARLGLQLAAAALRHRRRPRSLAERLAAFPRDGLPLRAPVEIRWNAQQVPFIRAESDRDLAVALGAVHAHLRAAQMEIMRRIAFGRLAEVAGPLAFDLDHTLRIMDFPATVAATLAMMPAESRDWTEGFVAGVNAALAAAPEPAEEFVLFGIAPQPWRVEDVLAVGRLAAVDFSWRVWHRLMPLRQRDDWSEVWERVRLAEAGPAPIPQMAGGAAASWLDMVWAGLGRCGSNAAAIAASRSASGGAMLTSDPHLSIMLPGNWLAVGLSSPGYRITGLMIPGLPVVTIGRNRHIAWSGTSLHAASSDLFDVTDLPAAEIQVRREKIRVRWSGAQHAVVRRTAHGPIISDAPLLKAKGARVLAMTWIGHRPSDELSAMLAMMRARSWGDFTDAIDGFAAPAQTFVFADAEGQVGQAMAAHLPERPAAWPADLVMPPDALSNWDRIVTARDLPQAYAPAAGFVASANDRPVHGTPVPVGFFFSPDERVRRLREMLGGPEKVGISLLRDLHRDVRMPSALAMRDLLLDALGASAPPAGPGAVGVAPVQDLVAALRAWDGSHDAESEGALAFELVLYHFLHQLHGNHDMSVYQAILQPWILLREDMALLPAERTAAAARAAAAAAVPIFARHRRWGAVHRLRIAHPLAALPVLGRRFTFDEFASGGSNETLMKTAHGFSGGPHRVTFGANARFIADMSDEDETWLSLLGGQDGWLGSSTFDDQVHLWRKGAYIRLPLRHETICRDYPHQQVLGSNPGQTNSKPAQQ